MDFLGFIFFSSAEPSFRADCGVEDNPEVDDAEPEDCRLGEGAFDAAELEVLPEDDDSNGR